MPKFLIMYNVGYGETADVQDLDCQEHADQAAKDAWMQAVEGDADYRANPLTVDDVINYSLDPDDLTPEQRKIYDAQIARVFGEPWGYDEENLTRAKQVLGPKTERG